MAFEHSRRGTTLPNITPAAFAWNETSNRTPSPSSSARAPESASNAQLVLRHHNQKPHAWPTARLGAALGSGSTGGRPWAARWSTSARTRLEAKLREPLQILGEFAGRT